MGTYQTIKVKVGNKEAHMKVGKRMIVHGSYICGGDDLYDLGFSAEEVKNNKVYLYIGGIEIELLPEDYDCRDPKWIEYEKQEKLNNGI